MLHGITGKELKVLLKKLEQMGFTILWTNNKHIKVEHPEVPMMRVVVSSSSSDWRALKNTRSMIRRAFPHQANDL